MHHILSFTVIPLTQQPDVDYCVCCKCHLQLCEVLTHARATCCLAVARAIKHDMIPDVSHSGFVFTDGCGFMSLSLATHISRNRNIMLSGTRYIPSVVQLRYR